jgi:hypothetical protein
MHTHRYDKYVEGHDDDDIYQEEIEVDQNFMVSDGASLAELDTGDVELFTCRRNQFGKLGPPLTPCWRMESNCFNIGCPLRFQHFLSNMTKYGWTSSMFVYM